MLDRVRKGRMRKGCYTFYRGHLTMRRFFRLAFLFAASAFMGPRAGAQPRPAPSTQAGARSGPLASALEAARTTEYGRAESELAAIRGADEAAAQVALGRVLLEQGKFAEAERHAQQAAATSAQRTAATAVRAEVLAAQGKFADAIKLIEPLKDAPGAAGRQLRLLLGEYRIATGHRKDAEDPLLKIIEEYNNNAITSSDAEGLAAVGRAAQLLRSPKDANTAFNESRRVDKTRIDMLLYSAENFLDKYDPGHAEEALKEALAIAPKNAAALVLMARVKLDQTLDFDAADKLIKDALAINPKLPSAYAVRAGVALRDTDLVASEAAIAAGLGINPNDTELWSLRAAAKFLGDDRAGYEQAKRETLARDAEYSQFYEIVGDFAEWEHRYDDIITMMRAAVALDPDDTKALAQLGFTLLRGGDEPGGLAALRKAYDKDHYNVRVVNTLNLYEQTISNQYETVQENVFRIRFPKDEKAVLSRYVPKLLAEAWGSMKARYSFVPTTPVQVELYSTREQFSVRTSGLPNIGIQGVCFGRVLAAMSPKSEAFNWGNVVWHELGHVFAIQLSKNHVPRWFTEGLSEYETIVRRPEWQRELDPELYLALSAGRLPGAVEMNRAFTHAADGNDVTVAYYAASQMLVFTAEQFGMPKIVQALKLWGEGLKTPDVIQRAFGVSPSEYDARYRAWETNRLKRYKGQFLFDDHPKALDDAKAAAAAAPADASAHASLALSLFHARKGDEAKKELEQALKIDPNQMAANYLAYKLAEREHDAASALAHLTTIQKAGGDGYSVEMALSELADARKDKAASRAALEAAARYDPSQSEPLKGLFDMANEEKRDADALDALGRLARLEQHDRRIWRLYLDRLVQARKWDEAKSVGESAVFVDVESASTHTGYARALAALGAHDKAIFELESAVLCSSPSKDLATAHALLAAELVSRNPSEARKHVAEALKLDPENPEAKGLHIP
jgi:tetratricopeptide (TPR) repeat protein